MPCPSSSPPPASSRSVPASSSGRSSPSSSWPSCCARRRGGPSSTLVDEREKQIASAIESAKRERAEAEKLLAEQKTAIAEARREAAEMMRSNQADVEKFREELMAKSRKEAEELKADARAGDRGREDQGDRRGEGRWRWTWRSRSPRSSSASSSTTAKHRALAEQFIGRGLAARRHAAGPSRRSSRRQWRSPWLSPSASSGCPTWASPPSSTRSPRRARRRRTTRSAPSSRTSAWCRCRTSGWTSSSALVKPQKTIPTSLEFVDIAGLVRGASKGEGLGNQFLANIRQVDAVLHVLRCFEDDNVTHVEGGVDPARDRDVVDTELCLKDLETVEKRRERAQKNAKAGGKAGDEAKAELALLDKVKAGLDAGITVRAQKLTDDEQRSHPRAVPAHRQAGALRREHRRGAARQGGQRPARAAVREMARRRGRGGGGARRGDRGGDPAAARPRSVPGFLESAGPERARPAQGGARRLPAAGAADLLHRGRAGVPRLDHPQGLARRRRRRASSTPTSSAASSRPR